MWNFNALAKNLQEQVEKTGLNTHLASAQARFGSLSEDLLDVKPASQSPHQQKLEAYQGSQNLGREDQAQQSEGAEDQNGWHTDGKDHDVQPENQQNGAHAEAGSKKVKLSSGSRQKESDKLKMELARMKAAAADALGELEETKERLFAAEDSLASQQEEVEQLQENSRLLSSKLREADKRAQTSESLVHTHKEEMAALEDRLKLVESKSTAELRSSQDRIKTLEAGLATARETSGQEAQSSPAPGASHDSATPSGGDPGSEVQAMKAKLQRAKRTLDNMKKREADALAAKAATDAELEKLREQANQVQQPVAAGEPVNEAESEISRLGSELQVLRAQLEEAQNHRRKAEMRSEESQAHILQLQSQINDLNEAALASDSRWAGLDAQKKELESLNKTQQASCEEARATAKSLEARVAELLSREAQHGEEVARLRSESETQFAQREESLQTQRRVEAGALRQQIVQLQEKLQSAEDGLAELTAMKDEAATRLQTELTAHQQEAGSSSAQLKSMLDLNQELQEQLRAAQEQIAALSAELQASQASIQKLQEERQPIPRPRQGSSGSSGELSEAGSAADSCDRPRGMSVKEIQQQHLFKLNSQLQDLEHRNQRAMSQLAEATAAKEELHRRINELETSSNDKGRSIQDGHVSEVAVSARQTKERELQTHLAESIRHAERLQSSLNGVVVERDRVLEQAKLLGLQMGQITEPLLQALAPGPASYEENESVLQSVLLPKAQGMPGSEPAADARVPDAVSEPATPEAGGSEGKLLGLRTELEATQAELRQQQSLVTELQDRLAQSASGAEPSAASTDATQGQPAIMQPQSKSELQLHLHEALERIAQLQHWAGSGQQGTPATHQEELAGLQEEGQKLTQELDSLQKTLREHTGDLLEARQGKEQAQAALTKSQQDLEAARVELASSSSRLQELERQIEAAEVDLEQARLMTQDADVGRSQVEAMEGKLLAQEARSAELQAQLDESCSRCQALESSSKQLQRSLFEISEEKMAIQDQLAKSAASIEALQEQAGTRENAVQALRDGSKAEVSMAVAACREAEGRAKRAKDNLAQVKSDLRQAEDRVETALQEGRRNQEAAQKRYKEAEGRIAAAEDREHALQQELASLQHSLASAKQESAAQAEAAEHRQQQQAELLVSAAVQEAESRGHEAVEKLEAALEAKEHESQDTKERLLELQLELQEALRSSETLEKLEADMKKLKEQLEASEAERVRILATLRAAEETAEVSKAAALERQKRFNLLNTQFKKREASLQQLLEVEQAAASEARSRLQDINDQQADKDQANESGAAEAARAVVTGKVDSHQLQDIQQLREQLETATRDLQTATTSLKAAQSHSAGLEQQLEAAQARVLALEAEAASAASAAAEANSRDGLDMDPIPASSIINADPSAASKAEAEARKELESVKGALAEAQAAAQTAEERAMAAEMAKIQLSMQLAEMDDRKFGDPAAEPQEEGEESFAHSVTARRAATAEQEADELRQKLSQAQATISQLEFQVTMASEPQLIGGAQREAGASSRVLDLFGCGANNRR